MRRFGVCSSASARAPLVDLDPAGSGSSRAFSNAIAARSTSSSSRHGRPRRSAEGGSHRRCDPRSTAAGRDGARRAGLGGRFAAARLDDARSTPARPAELLGVHAAARAARLGRTAAVEDEVEAARPRRSSASVASRRSAAPPSRAGACRHLAVERRAELAAGVRQEVRAARVLLGDLARRLGRGERDALVGAAGAGAAAQVQLDEHLAPCVRSTSGTDRRQDVVDRAERVAARGLHLVGVGGDEDDRRVRASACTGGSAWRSRSRRCRAC